MQTDSVRQVHATGGWRPRYCIGTFPAQSVGPHALLVPSAYARNRSFVYLPSTANVSAHSHSPNLFIIDSTLRRPADPDSHRALMLSSSDQIFAIYVIDRPWPNPERTFR